MLYSYRPKRKDSRNLKFLITKLFVRCSDWSNIPYYIYIYIYSVERCDYFEQKECDTTQSFHMGVQAKEGLISASMTNDTALWFPTDRVKERAWIELSKYFYCISRQRDAPAIGTAYLVFCSIFVCNLVLCGIKALMAEYRKDIG